jgi:protein gp37
MKTHPGIEWSNETFNIVWGCVKVSPACDNCYAEARATEWWGKDAPRRTFGESYWKKPLKWNEDAAKNGERPRVFCSSMADVFEKHPTVTQEREKLWPLIQATPNLDWLLLTKRHDNVEKNLPWGKNDVPWPNVWIEMSVENQQYADIRLPYLTKINAVVRWVSVEPLLGPADLSKYLPALDWIIVGGESGDNARVMQPAWAKQIWKDCQQAQVPFFFKQWGQHKPVAVNPDKTIQFVKVESRFQAGSKFLGKYWKALPTPKIGQVRAA